MPTITITDVQAAALARGRNITIVPEPKTYGEFTEGDIVVGPFVYNVRPADVVRIKDSGHSYGIGVGVVDSAVTHCTFVPVRVIVGNRISGGYAPEHLSKIKGATLR